MNASSAEVRSEYDGKKWRILQTLMWTLVSLIGSYAIANAVNPIRQYLSLTFEIAETVPGAWWLVKTFVTEAPLLVLFLIFIATVNSGRSGRLFISCAFTTALLQGAVVALFGLRTETLEMVGFVLSFGIITGIAGWIFGTVIACVTHRPSDTLDELLLGRWDDSQPTLLLLGGVVSLLFGGYTVVHGVQTMPVYLEQTIGQPRGGIPFFLKLYLVRAPLVLVFLLGTATISAVHSGGLVRSCILSMTPLLGMAFAKFGFPPKLLNVFYQAVPAGILLGIFGWMVGLAIVSVRHSSWSITV